MCRRTFAPERFAVNGGLRNPDGNLERHKDKIPVEHHILRHAPCGNGGQHKLRCDIHAEEHSAVALVPEAERNEQQSLDQQRRQQGREKLLCVIAPRIAGQDRVRGVVVGKFLPQAVALLHEREAGAVLCRDDDTELVRDAVIAIPEGVIRALYLAVHRRSRTIQHSQMPRSFSACIACRRPKIRYDPGIHLRLGKMVPVLIIKQLVRRFTRHEQIKIIAPARRIFHLDGYSRLWPHVSARRNRQQNGKQREHAENRYPLLFHNVSLLTFYMLIVTCRGNNHKLQIQCGMIFRPSCLTKAVFATIIAK